MADNHDVIVVGSGAGGGMMVHTLTKAGVNVLLLEAGRDFDPKTETAMFQWPREAPLRDQRTPDKNSGFFDATVNGGFNVDGQPYTTEGEGFRWWRARQLGGRTHHFGRQTPRYGPDDFKSLTNTGRADDWPVSYDDMEPYYDRVEEVMGLFGPDPDEAVHNSPQSPNHIRQEPPAPRASELIFAKALKKMGIKTMAHPTAILTSPLHGRDACFYATNCIRGCSIGAAFDSVVSFINPAKETGKLTILTNAVVYKVLVNEDSNKATGVRYINSETEEHIDVHAKVVVLAPAAMETSRILLNSKTYNAPDGLANSSGAVGKYLSDTTGAGLPIQIPALENLPPHNEDGVSQPHLYAPWWLHGDDKKEGGDADFSGGYKLEVSPYGGGRFGPPGMDDTFRGMLIGKKGLYGKKLKDYMRRFYGSTMTIRCLGSMTVTADNYLTLDPQVKDKWGIPVPKFHWKWSDEDFRRTSHMYDSLYKLAENMGAVVLADRFEERRKSGKLSGPGGGTNHEVGGTRMGDDPKTSVLNKYSQTWDVNNLYVADGGPFVTHTEKNPTLTIMALSMRAGDNIIDRLKKGEL
ncbi:MAG: GMC family oxidoreductase [Kordiimonadaceae bacterium]|mgnify:CR=1 FL=1|jgi:choline dehydrogenase-like flavoprotein|nr:GMC family oxidoreductase [Kordiimonadaceae bacterium]MBT6329518.1 GMC family oxidoreductase [Kordiimonadaceae bacterium]